MNRFKKGNRGIRGLIVPESSTIVVAGSERTPTIDIPSKEGTVPKAVHGFDPVVSILSEPNASLVSVPEGVVATSDLSKPPYRSVLIKNGAQLQMLAMILYSNMRLDDGSPGFTAMGYAMEQPLIDSVSRSESDMEQDTAIMGKAQLVLMEQLQKSRPISH